MKSTVLTMLLLFICGPCGALDETEGNLKKDSKEVVPVKGEVDFAYLRVRVDSIKEERIKLAVFEKKADKQDGELGSAEYLQLELVVLEELELPKEIQVKMSHQIGKKVTCLVPVAQVGDLEFIEGFSDDLDALVGKERDVLLKYGEIGSYGFWILKTDAEVNSPESQ